MGQIPKASFQYVRKYWKLQTQEKITVEKKYRALWKLYDHLLFQDGLLCQQILMNIAFYLVRRAR